MRIGKVGGEVSGLPCELQRAVGIRAIASDARFSEQGDGMIVEVSDPEI